MKPWRRKPDFIIGPEDNPYLLRWWLLPRNTTFTSSCATMTTGHFTITRGRRFRLC